MGNSEQLLWVKRDRKKGARVRINNCSLDLLVSLFGSFELIKRVFFNSSPPTKPVSLGLPNCKLCINSKLTTCMGWLIKLRLISMLLDFRNRTRIGIPSLYAAAPLLLSWFGKGHRYSHHNGFIRYY